MYFMLFGTCMQKIVVIPGWLDVFRQAFFYVGSLLGWNWVRFMVWMLFCVI